MNPLAPPQIDWGLTGITLPSSPSVPDGLVSVWQSSGSYVELWEMPDASAYEAPDELRLDGSDPLPTSTWPADRQADLAAAQDPNGDGRYALVELDYGDVLTIAQIAQIPAAVRSQTGDVYELRIGDPATGPDTPVVGHLWRRTFTKAGDTRDWNSDHWVFHDDYAEPSASNSVWISDASSSVTLEDYLTDAATAAGTGWKYAGVSYPLEPYDPSLVSAP